MIDFSLEISQPKSLFAFPHLMMSFPWHSKLMKVGQGSVAHFQFLTYRSTYLIYGSFHYNLCRCFHKRANQDILPEYLNLNISDIYPLFARVDFDNSPRYSSFLLPSINVCSCPSCFQECLVRLRVWCVLSGEAGWLYFTVQLN